MLFLYWFGRIVGDFLGDHRVVPLYLLSGLFGALVYLMFAPLINVSGSYAYGASASVMGFVMAAGLIAPEYQMRLLLIGDVKLKYIVLVLILLDLFGMASMENTGGHIAHLGGVVFGWIFVSMLRRGNDISVPINSFFDSVSRLMSGKKRLPPLRSTSKVYVRHKTSAPKKSTSDKASRTKDHQERLDQILDKIKDNGYDSLTAEEKEFLFLASKK